MNVFELILDKKIPAEVVHEDEHVLAFFDIHPVAPVHILIIPKKRGIQSLQEVDKGDFFLLGHIASVAQELAEKFKVAKSGYRLLTNVGQDAGQTVFHLHFHLIGGTPLGALVGER